jgi:histone H3
MAGSSIVSKKKKTTKKSTKSAQRKKLERLAHDPKLASRPHRFRPGTVAARKIKKEQKSTNYILRRAPLKRLMQQKLPKDWRISATGMELIRAGLEHYGLCMLRSANEITLIAKRQTVDASDVEHVLRKGVDCQSVRLY